MLRHPVTISKSAKRLRRKQNNCWRLDRCQIDALGVFQWW